MKIIKLFVYLIVSQNGGYLKIIFYGLGVYPLFKVNKLAVI